MLYKFLIFGAVIAVVLSPSRGAQAQAQQGFSLQ
jgi:hypothetical protein